MDNVNQTSKTSSQTFTDWILWWRINPGELKRQVDGYFSLNMLESARGISALCLIASALLTSIFLLFEESYISFVDVVILIALAFFIYKGYGWAMITAMIFWTLEKVYSFINQPFGNHQTSGIFGIIWWAVYMHAFWLAYKVEMERRKPVMETIELIEEKSLDDTNAFAEANSSLPS